MEGKFINTKIRTINNIYCKSSLDKCQLHHRQDLNINGVEIQLLGDFVYEPLSVEEYIDNIKPYVHSVAVVHAPLKRGEELMGLQMLDNEEAQKLFYKICDFAQHIASINKRDILVVIHNKLGLDDLQFHSESYDKIISCLSYTLNKNPNIKIAIENETPFSAVTKKFRDACLPDYIDVIKDLRAKIDTDRIGSVLDTCHAFVTIKFIEAIELSENIGLSLTIEDYFKANEGFCFLIHLCHLQGFGYKPNTHGISFTEESRDDLEEILFLHNTYTKDAAITIEVIEDDYTNCQNYIKTRTMIDEF